MLETLNLASSCMVLAPLTQMTHHSRDYFGIKKFSLRESRDINTYKIQEGFFLAIQEDD